MATSVVASNPSGERIGAKSVLGSDIYVQDTEPYSPRRLGVVDTSNINLIIQ